MDDSPQAEHRPGFQSDRADQVDLHLAARIPPPHRHRPLGPPAGPPGKAIVAVIGGAGSPPSEIACMDSGALGAAPRVSAFIGAAHLAVRVRALVSTALIRSPWPVQPDRASLNPCGAQPP